MYGVMEGCAERAKRKGFRQEFKLAPGSPSLDLYQTLGWTHLAAEAAGAMHGKLCDALGEAVASPLRHAARSVVALVLYMWGCRSNPLEWEFAHILSALAKARHGVRNHIEIWLLVRGTCLLEEGKACTLGAGFVEGHAPEEGDPLAPDHYLWAGPPGKGLWEGALLGGQRGAGETEEEEGYMVPWALVSRGILCVEHLCRVDAPVYMTWRGGRGSRTGGSRGER